MIPQRWIIFRQNQKTTIPQSQSLGRVASANIIYGITKAGYRVTALANRTIEKAETLRDKFFPQASIHQDYRDILKMNEVEVVDVTPHPTDRLPPSMTVSVQVNMCCQKPFVLDLEDAKKLVDMANHKKVNLAVNQNGWALHFSYIRNAVRQD